jgi:hypothetical protein
MERPEPSRVKLINLGKETPLDTNEQYCIISIAEPCHTDNNSFNSYFWIHPEEKKEAY